MTSALIWAALLGLTLGAGLLLILVTQPVGWRPSLEQRVEPQLRHHIPASRLLEEERAGASPWGAWGRILDPVVQAGVGWVQRISPGGVALDRKLAAAGLAVTSADFRAQQVLSAAAGAAVA